MNLKLRFFSLLFIAFLFPKCLFASSTLLHLDWKNYLAKYDLLWNRLPEKLWQSPFMGNGMLGTYIVYVVQSFPSYDRTFFDEAVRSHSEV